MISNAKQCSKFTCCNCDFSKIWCGLDEEFATLLKRAFEVIYQGWPNCGSLSRFPKNYIFVFYFLFLLQSVEIL